MLDWQNKTWLKIISVALIIAFLTYDIAWAVDFSSIQKKQYAPRSLNKLRLMMGFANEGCIDGFNRQVLPALEALSISIAKAQPLKVRFTYALAAATPTEGRVVLFSRIFNIPEEKSSISAEMIWALQQSLGEGKLVNIDSTRIVDMLGHILTNSLEAIEASPKDTGTLRIGIFMVGQELVLEVEDNGVGISEEALVSLLQDRVTTKGISRHQGGNGMFMLKYHADELGAIRIEIDTKTQENSARRKIYTPPSKFLISNGERTEPGTLIRIVLPIEGETAVNGQGGGGNGARQPSSRGTQLLLFSAEAPASPARLVIETREGESLYAAARQKIITPFLDALDGWIQVIQQGPTNAPKGLGRLVGDARNIFGLSEVIGHRSRQDLDTMWQENAPDPFLLWTNWEQYKDASDNKDILLRNAIAVRLWEVLIGLIDVRLAELEKDFLKEEAEHNRKNAELKLRDPNAETIAHFPQMSSIRAKINGLAAARNALVLSGPAELYKMLTARKLGKGSKWTPTQRDHVKEFLNQHIDGGAYQIKLIRILEALNEWQEEHFVVISTPVANKVGQKDAELLLRGTDDVERVKEIYYTVLREDMSLADAISINPDKLKHNLTPRLEAKIRAIKKKQGYNGYINLSELFNATEAITKGERRMFRAPLFREIKTGLIAALILLSATQNKVEGLHLTQENIQSLDPERIIVCEQKSRHKVHLVGGVVTCLKRGAEETDIPKRYEELFQEDTNFLENPEGVATLYCYWIFSSTLKVADKILKGLGWLTINAVKEYAKHLEKALGIKIVICAYSRAGEFKKFEEEVMSKNGFKEKFMKEFGRAWRGIEDFPYVVVEDTTKDKYTSDFDQLFMYFRWLKENGYSLNNPQKYFGLFLLRRGAYKDREGNQRRGFLVFDETIRFHANNALNSGMVPVIGPVIKLSREEDLDAGQSNVLVYYREIAWHEENLESSALIQKRRQIITASILNNAAVKNRLGNDEGAELRTMCDSIIDLAVQAIIDGEINKEALEKLCSDLRGRAPPNPEKIGEFLLDLYYLLRDENYFNLERKGLLKIFTRLFAELIAPFRMTRPTDVQNPAKMADNISKALDNSISRIETLTAKIGKEFRVKETKLSDIEAAIEFVDETDRPFISCQKIKVSPEVEITQIRFEDGANVEIIAKGEAENRSYIMVDGSMSVTWPALKRVLGALGIEIPRIEKIIITHADMDHAGGALSLARESGKPVYVHRDFQKILRSRFHYETDKQNKHLLDYLCTMVFKIMSDFREPDRIENIFYYKESSVSREFGGLRFNILVEEEFGDIKVLVLEAGGHTQDGIIIMFTDNKYNPLGIISGDVCIPKTIKPEQARLVFTLQRLSGQLNLDEDALKKTEEALLSVEDIRIWPGHGESYMTEKRIDMYHNQLALGSKTIRDEI